MQIRTIAVSNGQSNVDRHERFVQSIFKQFTCPISYHHGLARQLHHFCSKIAEKQTISFRRRLPKVKIVKRLKKILVAIDTSLDKNPIVEEATEIAHFNQASLTIVDIVPPFSWLARQSTEDHEHLSELIAKEKSEKLAALVAKASEKVNEVQSKVLKGKAAVEIIREVVHGEHDLVMAVAKGKHSKSDNYFGHTSMRLLRQCPSAVWLVAPDSTPKSKHILGCVDTASTQALDLELNDKIFEISQSISKYHNTRFSILHTWFMDDESMLSTRLSSQQILEYEQEERKHHEERLDKFLGQYNLACDSGNVHLVKGQTEEAIAEFIDANAVDLLVMGTVARKGLGGFFFGNTAEKILEHVECSVLALKPYGFKSSIKA